MGVLPCQFEPGVDAGTLGLDGSEVFDLTGLDGAIRPRQQVTLVITGNDGRQRKLFLTLRVDTGAELEYVKGGGILPCVLQTLCGP